MFSKFFKTSFLVILVFTFVSCSSDDEGPGEAPQVSMRAQVGGASFRTDAVSATLSNDGGLLTITGVSDVGESLTLRVGSALPDTPMITASIFEIDDQNNASMTFASGGVTFNSNAQSGGSIEIGSIDLESNTVFGSFAAPLTSGQEELNITAGFLFAVGFEVQ